jgi:hypothetical protein
MYPFYLDWEDIAAITGWFVSCVPGSSQFDPDQIAG